MADDCAGKAVGRVTGGVGPKGSCLSAYSWVQLIIEEGIAGEMMARLRKDGQQVDHALSISGMAQILPYSLTEKAYEGDLLMQGQDRVSSSHGCDRCGSLGRRGRQATTSRSLELR